MRLPKTPSRSEGTTGSEICHAGSVHFMNVGFWGRGRNEGGEEEEKWIRKNGREEEREKMWKGGGGEEVDVL